MPSYLISTWKLDFDFRSRRISSSLRCRHGHANAGLGQILSPTGRFSFLRIIICFISWGNLKIIISTGKSDWERDIENNKNSLAAAMTEVISNAPPVQPGSLSPGNGAVKDTQPSTGLFLASDSSRTSVLNGSHKTLCHGNDHETVLVFPDFKVVTEVRRSARGAQELWDSAVNPSIGRSGAYLKKTELKSWIIPYSCVILLC